VADRAKRTGDSRRSARTRGGQQRASLVIVGLLLIGALGIGAAAFVLLGGLPAAPDTSASASPGEESPLATLDPREPISAAAIQRVPHLVFQNVVRDENYAETSLVALGSPAGMRVPTGLICERVHFAAGHGICLTAEHDAESAYLAVLFDASFQPSHQLELDGAPTFARVSRDGRLAAASFQTSPPTAEMPFAPTETWLLDTSTGEVVADLADFDLVRDGLQLAEQEVDYWGVTFKGDGDGFYASVRFDGNIHLVEGSIQERQLLVLDSGISAPSLSLDESRIAYTRLVSNLGPTWRFHVRNLATGTDVELAEATSIDDQLEWMDSDHVLYGLATDIWRVPADGTGEPLPFLFGGLSPAVVAAGN